MWGTESMSLASSTVDSTISAVLSSTARLIASTSRARPSSPPSASVTDCMPGLVTFMYTSLSEKE